MINILCIWYNLHAPTIFYILGLSQASNFHVRVYNQDFCFLGSSVADPVHFFWIRIRVTQKYLIRPDPDPDPPYESFLMFSKINIFFYGIFLQNRIILWHFKSKIKMIWTKLYFRQFYLTRKFELQVFFL